MDENGNAALLQQESALAEDAQQTISDAPDGNITGQLYRSLTLTEAESYIEGNLITAARVYVANGYFLKRIRDDRLYEEAGYKNFDEYVQEKYGKKKDWASRCIKVNAQLSVGGDSPNLDSRYQEYSTYQLVELAYMTEEQREQAMPGQTVKELREIRRPKEIPYFEMDGQLDFETNFPEIILKPEPEEKPAPQVFTMSVEDLVGDDPEDGEGVAISQQPEMGGKCIHRTGFSCTLTDQDKRISGDGDDCSHKCCWNCVKHGECRLECYASVQRPKSAAEMQQNEPGSCENAAGAVVTVTTPEADTGHEKALSAYGTEKRVYPPDSLIAAEACEGGHYCFSCAMECRIRGEDRYCREAPMGNPFPCEHIVWGLQVLREEVGDRCQFVNHDLADHCAGSGETDPCCKNCADPCEHICGRAMRALDERQEAIESEKQTEMSEEPQTEAGPDPDVIDTEYTEIPEEEEYTAQYFLQKEQKKLNEILEAFKDTKPEDQPRKMIAHKKIIVAALAAMVCDLENAELQKQMQWPRAEQPELPAMRNNDQRKEFLNGFRDWPVWFRVPEASEVYYRYDLPDRTALVICEYHYYIAWMEKYDDMEPDWTGTREYLLTPGYHYLKDCQSNRSAMVEKLKEIQKKVKNE